jgi:hypothetical protein
MLLLHEPRDVPKQIDMLAIADAISRSHAVTMELAIGEDFTDRC